METDFPLSAGRPTLALQIPLWLLQRLSAHAAAQGLSVHGLAVRVLKEAVEE